jgi:hypothetical protein
MRQALVLSALLLSSTPGLARGETVIASSEPGPTEAHHFTVQLQGGVEGYTGPLSPRVDPGAMWGVSLAYDPVPFLGIEVGYTGAVNELQPSLEIEDPNPGGPDLIRHGGYFVITPGVPFRLPSSGDTSFKPYALGGLGLDRYLARGLTPRLGFQTQTIPNIPFGVGLRAHVGHLTADARVNGAWEFDNRFSLYDDHPIRVQGQVLLGAAF